MAEEDLLDGWGTPEPGSEFADRVLARVELGAAAERSASRRWWALAFAFGVVTGGLAVGVVATLRGPAPRGFERVTHVQIPGVADVVGERGSQLQWERRAGGEIVVEVVRGVAWVRRPTAGPAFVVAADGHEVELDGACGRVEVTRSFLNVDVAEDVVDCERVDAAVERARAELSDPSAR
jgi:hypothetical protein